MSRCVNDYRLPLPLDSIDEWWVRSSRAHVGDMKHAVDFGCDEGTPIYSAKGGLVVWVKNDSDVGGPQWKYYEEGNRIVLKHTRGEYTAYEHLQFGGVLVEVGQRVRKGQLIGYSGNTGFTRGPHLHFEVFTDPDEEESEGITLQVLVNRMIERAQ